MDQYRQNLLEMLKRNRISLKEASEAIGRNHAFLQQFVHRGSPRLLSEDDRIKLAALLNVPEKLLRHDAHFTMPAGDLPLPKSTQSIQNSSFATLDLPLLGMAEANKNDHSSFKLDTDPIKMVGRPPNLVNVRDAFALYVIGNSMHPRYKQGEMVYVNPRLPCRPGDDVLIKLADDTILIKELVQFDGQKTIFRQHNPSIEISLGNDDYLQLMRIAGNSGV
jgi:phage repressor protein C with HTH and peptisase S24 domain